MYNKCKNSKKYIAVLKILLIIFFIFIVVIIGYFAYYLYNSNKNKALYKKISIEYDNIIDEENSDGVTNNILKVINLKNKNSEVVGWIQIENTIIDYPILQTTDNNYYLTHNYKKENSKYGSIFVKSECDIQDINSNIIIYGHNMKDEQMFNTLIKYKDKDFYDEHKEIKIATEQEESIYTIVSVFKSRIFYQDETNVFRYYNYTKFENEENYNTFIENCKKIQLYDTGVSAEYGEQLITLITCEYSQENGRMVVVAKKD
jgi:sortase B